MANLLSTRSPPTSLGGVKSAGKDVLGVATLGLVIVAGIGLLGIVLPFARKIPLIGPTLFSGGLPGTKSSGMQVDAYGRGM